MADDERFNNGIFAIESLVPKLQQLTNPDNDNSVLDFIETVKLISSNESNTATRISCENIVISTPSEALSLIHI